MSLTATALDVGALLVAFHHAPNVRVHPPAAADETDIDAVVRADDAAFGRHRRLGYVCAPAAATVPAAATAPTCLMNWRRVVACCSDIPLPPVWSGSSLP
jgi:hypothetical protein